MERFTGKDLSVLPGLTSYVISLIIITILYRYRSRLFSQFEMLLVQREKLEHLAFYDTLTNIPNRKKIIEQLNHLISNSAENNSKFSLVFIDLNNFKKINDSLGHYVGDHILQRLVKRISSSITVSNVLKETGFDSKYLEFEVTESIFISYPKHVKKVLLQLKSMGISIALDDFGTGYSSLSFLQDISIDVLKIDKVFIDRISESVKKKIFLVLL
ncbi:GGDEF domain-containing phosphodiesterase [Halanaerobiaceae bacterium ANBcell28]